MTDKLDEKTIIEGNILITKLFDALIIDDYKRIYIKCDKLDQFAEYKYIRDKALKFHCDYNWLMLAIDAIDNKEGIPFISEEKIDGIGANRIGYCIDDIVYFVWYNIDKIEDKSIIGFYKDKLTATSKIEAIWLAVIEYCNFKFKD